MLKWRIMITGASGGLGSCLYSAWKNKYDVLGLAYGNVQSEFTFLDLTHVEPIYKLVNQWKPDIIVNTVALTNVDLCDQNLILAMEINTKTALHLRCAAESIGAKIVHISTNDVFDGQMGFYKESDLPEPLNFYSQTKLMAEKMFYNYEQSLILRFTFLSWQASGKTTFLRWLVNSLSQGKEIRLFQDQFTSTLYVSTLADWIETLFGATGLYHLGSERKSRYESGLAIAEALALDTSLIVPGKLSDIHFDAPRSLDVSLNCDKVFADYGLRTTFNDELKRMQEESSSFLLT